MSNIPRRPNPDNHDPTKHGNQSHGIRAAEYRLQKGKPFDGHLHALYLDALDRRGLTEPDLDGMGARGDYTRNVCRLVAVLETVWGGSMLAASCGDVGGFFGILKEHGHRYDQLARMLKSEIDLLEVESGILDLSEAVAAAKGAKG